MGAKGKIRAKRISRGIWDMGESKNWKRAFLMKHPRCCFCGGTNESAEPDHVPSRAFFESKQWPEGFVFPACVACNRGTRHDEQKVAMLSWLFPDAATPVHSATATERIRAVAENYPAFFQELRPTARQRRNARGRFEFLQGPGVSLADLPLVSMSGPLVSEAIENFSRKLFCALYYKHTAQILPRSGSIALRWYTNLQLENDELPNSVLDLLSGLPKLIRATTKLDNQFTYRWVIVEDLDGVAAFLAFFRESFAILGYARKDGDFSHLPPSSRIVHPNQ